MSHGKRWYRLSVDRGCMHQVLVYVAASCCRSVGPATVFVEGCCHPVVPWGPVAVVGRALPEHVVPVVLLPGTCYADSIKVLVHQNDVFRTECQEVMGNPVDARALSKFQAAYHWHTFLSNLDLAHVYALTSTVLAPKETHYTPLQVACTNLIKSIHNECIPKLEPSLVLPWLLNESGTALDSTRPHMAYQQPATQAHLGLLVFRLVIAALRLRFPIPMTIDFDLLLPPDAVVHLDNIHSLLQNTPPPRDQALFDALYEFLYSIFTCEHLRAGYAPTSIERWLLLVSITSDGSWITTRAMAPLTSKIKHCIRDVLAYYILEHSYDTDNQVCLAFQLKASEHVRPYHTLGKPFAFHHITRIASLLFVINENTPKLPDAHWSEDRSVIYLGPHVLETKDICEGVERVVMEVETVFKCFALQGLDLPWLDELVDKIMSLPIIDQHSKQEIAYSVLEEEANTLIRQSRANLRILQDFFARDTKNPGQMPTLIRPNLFNDDGSPVFEEELVRVYLSKVDRAKLSLGVAMQLTGGGPMRATEFMMAKIHNNHFDIRNLHYYNRMFALHTMYTKVQAQFKSSGLNILFYPQRVTRLIWKFNLCIKPLEVFLYRKLGDMQASILACNYFFNSGTSMLMATDYGNTLKELMLGCMYTDLGIAAWCQLVKMILRAVVSMDIDDCFDDDDEEPSAIDETFNHT
ncbi:hypothetical protein CALVIDRAFT_531817 [Calocera viscosa TUFC12733]|uniref:Uncharacterized protein n=1 Tax=Calocera viscosa (strain TUFC12733) TaxID=1330018 RepID=A0A167FU62_CALVF|nr:hypothetical protein CALVIDRAFT_531817 [Calocera viscosa TUFC12733]